MLLLSVVHAIFDHSSFEELAAAFRAATVAAAIVPIALAIVVGVVVVAAAVIVIVAGVHAIVAVVHDIVALAAVETRAMYCYCCYCSISLCTIKYQALYIFIGTVYILAAFFLPCILSIQIFIVDCSFMYEFDSTIATCAILSATLLPSLSARISSLYWSSRKTSNSGNWTRSENSSRGAQRVITSRWVDG